MYIIQLEYKPRLFRTSEFHTEMKVNLQVMNITPHLVLKLAAFVSVCALLFLYQIQRYSEEASESLGFRTCFMLKDVRDFRKVDMLKAISTCGGTEPVLLSKKFLSDRVPGKRRAGPTESRFVVPNIVHYVYIHHPENEKCQMNFLAYLSFLGVHKYIQPNYIFIHGNCIPTGYWWNRIVNDVVNIFHVPTTPPDTIFGKIINCIEQKSDQLRIRTVHSYGGIYLDTDVLVFKSFDPVRIYNFTLGREHSRGLASSIIIGAPGAKFLRIWFESYRTFSPEEWSEHAVLIPHTLSRKYPLLINVDDSLLIRPYYTDRHQLVDPSLRYDWSNQLSCHVWKKYFRLPANPGEIANFTTTLIGEMERHVYFGTA